MPRVIRRVLAAFGSPSMQDLQFGVFGIWSGQAVLWQFLLSEWRYGSFAWIRRLLRPASRTAGDGAADGEQGDENMASPQCATPWTPAVAVEAAEPFIVAMPWEFAAGAGTLFRTVTGAPLEDTVRYLRRGIQLLELPQTATDDPWQQVVRELGGGLSVPPNAASARTKDGSCACAHPARRTRQKRAE